MTRIQLLENFIEFLANGQELDSFPVTAFNYTRLRKQLDRLKAVSMLSDEDLAAALNAKK